MDPMTDDVRKRNLNCLASQYDGLLSFRDLLDGLLTRGAQNRSVLCVQPRTDNLKSNLASLTNPRYVNVKEQAIILTLLLSCIFLVISVVLSRTQQYCRPSHTGVF